MAMSRTGTGSDRAFTLIELLIVLFILAIMTTAAAVQFNSTVEQYDLTRMTSEIIGKLETVRAECVKQSGDYPAAALSIVTNTVQRAYKLQYYYRDSASGSLLHTDYEFNMAKGYTLQATPNTITYTFNPRGKALAYGSAEFTRSTPPLAALPVITIQHNRNVKLRRRITISIAGNISVTP
jgi:prepilin-type N-terminal cleavage/methylation domain-containing protein